MWEWLEGIGNGVSRSIRKVYTKKAVRNARDISKVGIPFSA
jgi:hypothetical protein